MAIRYTVLTISTSGARGERGDRSGREIQEMLTAPDYELVDYQVVSDEEGAIQERLRGWADGGAVDLIVTTGGTGLTSRDVTPEATRGVLHREIPGIAEAMRVETLNKTPMAMLSRSVAGVRGRTLIVNLPGSPKGARECLEVIKPVLSHAVELIQDEPRPSAHEAR